MSVAQCFQIDNSTGSSVNVYDVDRKGRTYLATRYGTSSQTGLTNINVPLYPFSDVEVEDRCVLLLLEAVKDAGWARRNAYEAAEVDFNKRDLRLRYVLSSSDHRLIPPGHRIAVAEAEYLGRIVVSGTQRGVVLFNPEAVIGYQYRGKSSYECVLSDDFFAWAAA